MENAFQFCKLFMKIKLYALILLISGFISPLAGECDSAVDCELPKILIIGDSISIGYTPFVAEAMEGEAIVRRISGNAMHTENALRRLDDWLGNESWAVIHFNWGLWDMAYRSPTDRRQGNKEHGTPAVAPELYRSNLALLLSRLQETGAALVWAHTTLVPEDEPFRFVGDDLVYNRIAAELMEAQGVYINDLNALSRDFPPAYFVKPGDVHYVKEGSQRLAEQVVESLREVLNERP
jgi:hypothetical protein